MVRSSKLLGLIPAVANGVICYAIPHAAGVPELFTQVTPEHVPRLSKVRADSKYHNCALQGWMKQQWPTWDLEVVARPRGTKGFMLLAKRWVAEHTFSWTVRCRRHSKDYERRTDSSEAMIKISSFALMTRRLAPSTQAHPLRYTHAA